MHCNQNVLVKNENERKEIEIKLILILLCKVGIFESKHNKTNWYIPPYCVPPEQEESSEVEGSGDASSAQQQQAPNVESGLYYVLLADGRLQRVEYVTAPLNAFESEKQTAFAGFPGFQIQPVEAAAPAKPLKYQNQPPQTANQFQVGAFQGKRNEGKETK